MFQNTVTLSNGTTANDVVVNKSNQDSGGVTFFSRSTSGDEYKLNITRSYIKPRNSTRAMDQHRLQLTHTKYDSVGTPTVYSAVCSIQVPKGTELDDSAWVFKSLARFADSSSSDVLGHSV
jgi:hypothetical protein